MLTAPAERVDAEIVLEVFRPLAAPAPLPRPKPLAAALEPEPAPLDEPLSGRTPRRAAAATPATPLPRPTRKTLAAAAALREAELLALQPVVAANPEAAAPTRDVPVFTPAPVLTQEQWAQLTQRNTRKNKQHFNKLSVDELVLDENRPPSPTSKIRKSVSGTSTESRKEGREDRAKKRRSALRSSLDGSVVGEDDVVVPASPIEGPLAHFRAAGDDEEYSSPVRGGVLKGKKKSSLAGPESRRVKWDKALVYEGPVTPHGESAGILKVRLLPTSIRWAGELTSDSHNSASHSTSTATRSPPRSGSPSRPRSPLSSASIWTTSRRVEGLELGRERGSSVCRRSL